MNFIKWYAPIVVSLSIAINFVDWVVSEFDNSIALLAIIIYAPIAIYLWRILVATK